MENRCNFKSVDETCNLTYMTDEQYIDGCGEAPVGKKQEWLDTTFESDYLEKEIIRLREENSKLKEKISKLKKKFLN